MTRTPRKSHCHDPLPMPTLLMRPTRSALLSISLATAAAVGATDATAQQRPDVGVVATLASPIEAGSGGMEVDAGGNVYTADFGAKLSNGPVGTRVFRITPMGGVEVFAEGFEGASGNAIGPAGQFHQANIAGNTISVVEADGTVSSFATEGLANPVGIAFEPSGTMVVANCGGNTIARVDAQGVARVFARSDLLQCPNGLVVAPTGDLYASNFYNGDILRISPEGEVERFVTLPGGNNGHLVYGNGVFYVAARGAHQIYELGLDGRLTLLAGSGVQGLDDGPAMEATLSYPNDLALSPDATVLYWNDVAAIAGDGGQTLSPTAVRMLRLR